MSTMFATLLLHNNNNNNNNNKDKDGFLFLLTPFLEK